MLAPADEEGRYRGGFGPLEGRPVAEAAAEIAARLRAAGLLVREAPHRHRYPTCWRCGQELIFRVVDEWFIRADEIRPRALAANAAVTWLPEHMGRRMHDWLTNMGDWCISRKRYWGVPLPFYPCAGCGRTTVVGGVAELRALAVDPAAVDALQELHRPWIDAVAIRCPGCGRPVSRVAEVGDCWLDAGIVPFSTLPYLEDRAAWARWFPADLVVEMAAQIRGWFYALLFMSVALEDRAPYRVVVAHDRVLGEDGREMHKSWGNAVWLDEALDRMGPDAVRYLFAAHPMADPIRFGEGAAREVTRRFLTLWNVLGLFVTYANLDRPALAADAAAPRDAAGLEAWILSRLHATIREVRGALDGYQLRRALGAIEDFVQEDLSNWYVRRRRRQFWKGEMTAQKASAYRTLHHVLVRVAQLLAPVTPFVADRIYRTLIGAETDGLPSSVHLTRFPEPDPGLVRPDLDAAVDFVRRAVTLGLAVRNAAGVRVRQPLARAVVRAPAPMLAWLPAFASDLADELNVEAVEHAAVDGGAPAEPAGEASLRAATAGDADRRAGSRAHGGPPAQGAGAAARAPGPAPEEVRRPRGGRPDPPRGDGGRGEPRRVRGAPGVHLRRDPGAGAVLRGARAGLRQP